MNVEPVMVVVVLWGALTLGFVCGAGWANGARAGEEHDAIMESAYDRLLREDYAGPVLTAFPADTSDYWRQREAQRRGYMADMERAEQVARDQYAVEELLRSLPRS